MPRHNIPSHVVRLYHSIQPQTIIFPEWIESTLARISYFQFFSCNTTKAFLPSSYQSWQLSNFLSTSSSQTNLSLSLSNLPPPPPRGYSAPPPTSALLIFLQHMSLIATSCSNLNNLKLFPSRNKLSLISLPFP